MHTETSAMTQTDKRWVGQHRRHPSVVRHRRRSGPGVTMGVLIGMVVFVVIVALSVAVPAVTPSPPGRLAVPDPTAAPATSTPPGTTRVVPPVPETATEPGEGGDTPTVAGQPTTAPAAPTTGRAEREAITVESQRCGDKGSSAPSVPPSTEPSTTTPNEGVSPS